MRTQFKRVLSMALVLCMVLALFPVNALATTLTMGIRPVDGTTTGNPFAKGTGGSNSFRIPAMVTLSDGTIVAAADARWNTTYDGGGLDTVVSYSTDNGANWNYTFANYLGDNGNVYNGSGSTAFIDPALATDGNTVYMLCDLYPYGVALNGSVDVYPHTAVGFNDDGTLKLAASGSSTYDYYLKDGQIYDSSNSVVSGYTVDDYFNITGNGYDTNLFFSDSPYQVVRTGYLYLTSSTDGGKNWSAPNLIPNVKTSTEQVCLVGPGRGLVTSDGKIVFPVYSYNGSDLTQQTGFIYTSDGGTTWTRSANFTGATWSSESAVVELSDKTLRFFYRNSTSALCYADYTWGTGWGSAVNTGIATNSNTQLSAISYSKTVGGKQVILVSCPTGPNEAGSADSNGGYRTNGKIFTFTVGSNNEMTLKNSTNVTSGATTALNGSTYTEVAGFFAYSCLTELKDGSVAILYENNQNGWGSGDGYYYTMNYKTYTAENLGLTADSSETGGENGGENGSGNGTENGTENGGENTNTNGTTKYITLKVGETKTVTDTTGNYEEDYTTPDPAGFATMTVEGGSTTHIDGTATQGSSTGFDGSTVQLKDCLYTFTSTGTENQYYITTTINGETYYVQPYSSTSGRPNVITQTAVTVSAGSSGNRVKLSGNGGSLHFHAEQSSPYWNRCQTDENGNCNVLLLYRPVAAGEATSTELPGYVQISMSDIKSGNQYIIAAKSNDGDYYVLYPTSDTTSNRTQMAKVTGESTSSAIETTQITFTGKSAGKTTAVVGGTTYNITVVNEVDVKLDVNETKVVTNTTGNYSSVSTAPDETIATVSVNGVTNETKSTVVITSTEDLRAGNKYFIYKTRTLRWLTNDLATDVGTLTQLDLTSETGDSPNPNSEEVWTITPRDDGGYDVQDSNGKYLNIQENTTFLSDTAPQNPTIFTFFSSTSTDATNVWGISQGEYYLYNYNRDHSACGNTTSAKDAYPSQWKIYRVDTETDSHTYVTITGVTVGSTSAIVGTTQYNITVQRDHRAITILKGSSVTFTDSGTPSVDNNGIASATLSDGNLTITGNSVGSTTITTNTTVYTVNVVERATEGTGVIIGSTDITGMNGTEVQNCPVGGQVITSMLLTEGISYDLDSSLTGATWSSADTAIATVDKDGVVTAVATGTTTITVLGTDESGNAVTCTINVTVIAGPDASAAATRTVALYIDNIDDSQVYCSINGSADLFEVYEGELIYGNFKAGTANDTDRTTTTAFSFFAAPDKGYAVTYMNATNSAGNYYLLHTTDENGNKVIGNGADYYYNTAATSGAGYWQALGLNGNSTADWNIVKAMVEAAIAKKCDGGQGFTRRQDEGDLCQGLSFISRKLPTVEKTVFGVLGSTELESDFHTYTEGMTAKPGEWVFFKIVVTTYDTDENNKIKYANMKLVDTMDGDRTASFVRKIQEGEDLTGKTLLPGNQYVLLNTNAKDLMSETLFADQTTDKITVDGNEVDAITGTQKKVSTYFVAYQLKDTDLDMPISNSVSLTYDYKAAYRTGSYGGTATDNAKITATTFAAQDIVVDFGLPVTVHIEPWGKNDILLQEKGSATYGDVKVAGNSESGWDVTYTPTKTLEGVDTVTMYGTDDNTYSFKVYPATTVYYEEGFATYGKGNDSTGWRYGDDVSAASTGTVKQETAAVGATQAETKPASNYGYDAAYATGDYSVDESGNVVWNGTQAASTNLGDSAVFEFTGTGVDIYANCTPKTGTLMIVVELDGALKRIIAVDTKMAAVKNASDATTGQGVAGYNIPVVSLTGMDYGNYTLRIFHVKSGQEGKREGGVKLDGFRVYGTLEDQKNAAYVSDLEDDPTFIELRDKVLAGLNVSNYVKEDAENKSQYADQIAGGLSQAYNSALNNNNDGVTAEKYAAVLGTSSSTETNSEGTTESNSGDTSNGDTTEDKMNPVQDLLDNGPKNEIYLQSGYSLVFKVTTNRVVQIGLKALNQSTSYTIQVGTESATTPESKPLSSSTEMYYPVLEKYSGDGEREAQTITITNTGSGILSITKLKICDDPNTTLCPLTEEDLIPALVSLGFEEAPKTEEPTEPDKPADPEESSKPTEPVKPTEPAKPAEPVKPTEPSKPTEPEQPETPDPEPVENPFTDVEDGKWYTDSVLWAVSKGITKGTSNTTFSPETPCSRGQVVTFLWRAMGCPAPKSTENPFTDIQEGTFYYDAVLWAYENQITTGLTETTFGPEEPCSRAEVVTFLWRCAGKPESEADAAFTDLTGNYYLDAVAWAVENKITEGTGGNKFSPEVICNRANIVTFLYRHFA